MGLKLRRRKETNRDIDISPLIDVVFILLIFFMVTTTFVKDMKLDLERPSAAMATNEPMMETGIARLTTSVALPLRMCTKRRSSAPPLAAPCSKPQ